VRKFVLVKVKKTRIGFPRYRKPLERVKVDSEAHSLYLERRRFLKMGLAGASALGAAAMLSGIVRAPSSTELVLNDDHIRMKGEVADPSLLDGMIWYRSDLGRLRFSPDGVSAKSVAHTDDGGAPSDADYLVGTANAGLSAEIVVGTTPGGELGGTWGSPTVDATHSGTAHHAQLHAAAHVPAGGDVLQATQTNIVFGRDSAGAGAMEEITAAALLTMLGAYANVVLQAFITPGANTYTPTSGMKHCLVISTGGGGGGGGGDASGAANVGAGAGGGAGGTCTERFTAADIGPSQTVTIGAAGAAGSTSGGAGGSGGNTTFGALHTATGGVGGNGSGNAAKRAQTTSGGAGGIPTAGLLNITGGDGSNGFAFLTLDATDTNVVSIACGGQGGASYWGGGGRGGQNAQDAAAADSTAGSEAGQAGKAYGSGGGGGVVLNTATGVAGGAGVAGACLVIEFV
jgi:hypothetical protein